MSCSEESLWWVYILLCGDGSFYTGIARDVEKRFAVHQKGQGAKYTRAHKPQEIWCRFGPYPHGQALQEEIRVKRLSHQEKGALKGIV
jgi:predicted GIY-YIG superfamily endonuclease